MNKNKLIPRKNARAWKHQNGGVAQRKVNLDAMKKDPEWNNFRLYMNLKI